MMLENKKPHSKKRNNEHQGQRKKSHFRTNFFFGSSFMIAHLAIDLFHFNCPPSPNSKWRVKEFLFFYSHLEYKELGGNNGKIPESVFIMLVINNFVVKQVLNLLLLSSPNT